MSAPWDTSKGATDLFLGEPGGLGTVAAWSAGGPTGAEPGPVTAGDLDGDGYADVAISGPTYSLSTFSLEGEFRVYLGSAAGLGASPSVALTGTKESGELGYAITFAGDVDGDGLGDLAVGEPQFARDKGGHAYLFLGGTGGIDTDPAWVGTNASNTFGGFGAAIAALGDQDDDGFADLALFDSGAGTYGTLGSYRGGCVDGDADGVCDTSDACPGADDALDADGDGVPDECDPCPTRAACYELAITGTCPGSLTVELTGFTPGADVAILADTAVGAGALPAGACAGTVSGLAMPRHVATRTADAAGNAGMRITPPTCGAQVQAVDLTTCAVSEVAPF